MARSRYDLYIEHNADDSSLVLVRFPAMRSQFDNEPEHVHLSIKPKSMKMKLDVTLDTKSTSYCSKQAEELAKNSFPGEIVDRNFFVSTKIPVEDDQLFVCKIINDKMVCRPVSNILTMRSDFNHLDEKETIDLKEEVRPVSVKFAAPDRQNIPPRVHEHNEDDDPLDEFRTLSYKNISSREANTQRSKLFGCQMAKVKPDPDAETLDQKPQTILMPDIKPKIEKLDAGDIYTTEMGLSKHLNQVKQMVKECLMRAKIVSFGEIYSYLRASRKIPDNLAISNRDMLDGLNDYALLVQGNWAVKSAILYGDSSQRNNTGVTAISITLFNNARDYLLWLFSQDRFVSRSDFTKAVKIPDYDALELFNQLAILRKDSKKWELKLPTDKRFLDQFIDVVNRQANIWTVRRSKFRDELGI